MQAIFVAIVRFSALQRAEIAEIYLWNAVFGAIGGFSALQRAEIAEILDMLDDLGALRGFSALQRAEIAEIHSTRVQPDGSDAFQCSSTSRNC